MIRCEGLSLRFGSFLLEDIDLAVEPGESYFVLGPSGAGKTLLLEGLLGIRRPEAGRVLLGGRDATRLPPEERQVAYVPQDLALFPHLSVRDNVLFGLRARGRPPADAARRLARWAELLDLGPVIDRRDVRTLSGGERQRVALARALVTEPRVLFMDEPFSALDAALRRRLQVEFRDLQRRLGLTLIQVTHDPEEAFLMADHMAILMAGRIEQRGRPGELYNRPVNLRVARFLMLQNLYPGRLGPRDPKGYHRLTLDGTGIAFEVTPHPEFAEGSPVVAGIRPEEVILLRPTRPPDTARQRNLLLGVVEGWADLGHYRLVRLRVGGLRLDAWLNIRAAREYPMEEGTEVWFHVRPWSFCLLRPD
ncbi:MAG: ABC transporter ATP-binding protein [Deferrisomatales bacterium]|nr:ABC transporter ATP-binding protein [Deferrisomatales bacterium]